MAGALAVVSGASESERRGLLDAILVDEVLVGAFLEVNFFEEMGDLFFCTGDFARTEPLG
jgi:hypothetical protein